MIVYYIELFQDIEDWQTWKRPFQLHIIIITKMMSASQLLLPHTIFVQLETIEVIGYCVPFAD